MGAGPSDAASGKDPFGWVGGTVNGKYRIDAAIGEGGFGVVYKAHHLGFEETVAVKCLRIPPGLQGQDREKFFASFMDEGRLLHRLSRATAGIVQALDVGGAESPNGTWTPYLVLEWLEGRTLEADLEEREIARLPGRPLAEALELLDPAARALGLVHEQGIAHRDIKPANLFLADVGGRRTLKILDFGIAKVLSETASLTRAFEATGSSLQAFSPRYGAPEQFSRRYGATGPWTDVFAFALVLVEVVSGRHALDGDDAAQLFVSSVDPARRPTLRACGVEYGDAIEAVLTVALSIEPKDRYVSSTEFWDALLGAAQASGIALPVSSARGMLPSVVQVESRAAALPSSDSAGSIPERAAPWRAAGDASTQLAASTMPRPSVTPDTRPTPFRIALAALASTTVFALVAGAGLLFIDDDDPESRTAAVESESAELGASATPSGATAKLPPSASAAPAARPAATPPADTPAPLGPFTVSQGRAAERAPWYPEFRVDPGPDEGEATAYAALARCEKKGMSLCTEPQWERACVSERALASRDTWTLSAERDGFVVRGGASCGDRRLIAGAATAGGAGLPGSVCCERAVGIATTNYVASFLAGTASRLLTVETKLNSHDANEFGALLADKVGIGSRIHAKATVLKQMEALFAEHPDEKITLETCKVAMQGAPPPKRRTRRRKAPATSPTWQAECELLRRRAHEAATTATTYVFTGSAKLKAIVDGEATREWSPP